MSMEFKEFKDWELENQHRLNRRLQWYAKSYGDKLTYNQVTQLYALAVDEVLIIYQVKNLSDIPWGIGYNLAKNLWLEKLDRCIHKEYNGRVGGV